MTGRPTPAPVVAWGQKEESNHDPSAVYEQFAPPECPRCREKEEITTYRISLRTGSAEPFVACLSPRRSPSQNFYACRSYDDDWPDPNKAPEGMQGEEIYRRTARWVE